MVIRIGTRASHLALAQTRWVINRIWAQDPDIRVDVVKIKTRGDSIHDRPLSAIGGKGLFVKEIEGALERGEIELAVHSLKDVPAELPDNLCIGIIPDREDPHDVMISKNHTRIEELPQGSCIGTSSLRRSAQLLHFRQDLKIAPLRGNLETRIRKLHRADIDAIVVAAAGLRRIGCQDTVTQSFSFDLMLPAIGQGALGLELRRDDHRTRDTLAFLDHYPTRIAVEAERSFLKALGAGCQLPVAGFASLKHNTLHLDGLVANSNGSTVFRDVVIGPPEKASELGATLAQRLLDEGASEILDEIYGKRTLSTSRGKGVER
jgi:hydroxymethylbilane synthase